MSNKVIGIDLGTTNSSVAVFESNQPTVIANSIAFRTTPSVVTYTPNSNFLVGQAAQSQASVNYQNTFYSVKRFVGKEYDEITQEIARVAYEVLQDSNKSIEISCPALEKILTPQEILADIIRKLVEDASHYLGKTITQAVIAVPTYFDHNQRLAISEAGKIAGIEVLKLINDTVAVAMAYGLDKKENKTVLVFDLGGGHCGVSLLETGDGIFQTLAHSGNTQLGGDDYTQKIVDYLVEQFHQSEGIDLRQDKQALQRLREAAEQAKIKLSSLSEAEIYIPAITTHGCQHLHLTITSEKFDQLCSDLMRRCSVLIEKALQDAKVNKDDIDEILLVGGSSRLPMVQKLIKQLLGKEPKQGGNFDDAVALGAAVQAGVLAGEVKDVLLLDATSLSLGVETLGGVMTKLIPRNSTIPSKKSEIFSTAVDGQTNVEIKVYQGEQEKAEDNKCLGLFRLNGIPPAKKGEPKIEVTFDIDANNILNVTAKDQGTGHEIAVTFNKNNNITTPKENSKQKFKTHQQQATNSTTTSTKSEEIKSSRSMGTGGTLVLIGLGLLTFGWITGNILVIIIAIIMIVIGATYPRRRN